MAAVYKQLSGNDREEDKPTGEKRNKQRVLILVLFAPQTTGSHLTADRVQEVSHSVIVTCYRISTP